MKSDYTEQLQTERMMLLSVVQRLTADMELVIATGRLEACTVQKILPDLQAAWTAIEWIRGWSEAA